MWVWGAAPGERGMNGQDYPVVLRLSGRRCVVVGGGRIAARKVEGLLAAGADVTVIAPEIDPGIAGVQIERRAYRSGDLDGAWLAITATGDPGVDGQVYADGEVAGVLVNSADDPEHCAFTLPAVARQGSITVAVSTGGRSPAYAVWLRDRLGAELGPEHEALLRLLEEHRSALRSEGTPTEGLSWQDALESEMLDLVRAGRIAEARERLQACL